MSFWAYCEKLQGFIGFTNVIRNVNVIYEMYKENKTIGDVVQSFENLGLILSTPPDEKR